MRKVIGFVARAIRELFWIAAAAAIVVGGFVGFNYLGENREVVTAEPAARPVTLVETAAFEPVNRPLPIRGEGFVEPFRTVSLSAPTGGRIVMLHPAITNRNGFQEGDVLVEIDASNERAQIAQAKAAIAATEARLDLIDTQLTRASNLLERNAVSQATVDDLLGQQEEVRANLEGQRAQLASAEIALENKIVRAPFDGSVQTKEAEIGNVVAGGSPIAQIYTDDRMEVSVAIRESDAALIPGLFEGRAAPATVTIAFAGIDEGWRAEIVRVDPSLDPQTRTLTATVALRERIEGDAALASGAPPALINAFAQVVIDGIEPANTYAIPSTALRDSDTIWLLRDGVLAIHPASLVHVDGETSFVEILDLMPDDRLILTTLAAPQPGKALRDIVEDDRMSLVAE
ncbi:efflux RND transporter periplasmic adaptor subunit [Cognatiyoonia sp. IB215446]|uniref:efflux RND transporter periplasmic adaptor subunit n=1 Tax=Cognatiyoonia sp. IB215446 TaxID=3097355 RepID=UPI002A115384|nr:efflux RND transporter periplasmic adaptor subunit [Cognatiyoonia sp. IB215446]MDX8347909.1 efflux RND transporter periplasmic adaptor subunit [Cognatiyoonia sp. IB215446]